MKIVQISTISAKLAKWHPPSVPPKFLSFSVFPPQFGSNIHILSQIQHRLAYIWQPPYCIRPRGRGNIYELELISAMSQITIISEHLGQYHPSVGQVTWSTLLGCQPHDLHGYLSSPIMSTIYGLVAQRLNHVIMARLWVWISTFSYYVLISIFFFQSHRNNNGSNSNSNNNPIEFIINPIF